MIMASDGVWDHVTGRRAMQEARKSNIYDCAVDLVALAEEKSKGQNKEAISSACASQCVTIHSFWSFNDFGVFFCRGALG